MTRIFCLSVAGGVLLALLAGGLFPLPQSPRYRSAISVIPDGGREETFLIEWPDDRLRPLSAAGAAPLQLAGSAVVASAPGGVAAMAELYRVRDVAGNVIGIASRTVSPRGGTDIHASSAAEWMLLLPSRGTLFLSQVNARDIAPQPAQMPGQWRAAADSALFWGGAREVRITAGPADDGAGRVVGGTEEFAELQGDYEELWELVEMGAEEASRGRIRLTTRMRSGS